NAESGVTDSPVRNNAGPLVRAGDRRTRLASELHRRRSYGLFTRRRTGRARAPPAIVAALRRALVGLCRFADAAARDHRFGDLRREQPDRAQRIVVAGNHEVDFVGIAIGVDDPDDRNLELARFVDGDLFLARVDDEDRVGQPRHVADPFEVLLPLAFLFLDRRYFLLRDGVVATVGLHRLEVAQPCETALNRGEVGEQPAEPSLVDEEHAAALRLFRDRVLSLTLGADEQN